MSSPAQPDVALSSPTGKPRVDTVHGHSTASLPALGVAALGIVFGDIGTSPLYTLTTVLELAGGKPDAKTPGEARID